MAFVTEDNITEIAVQRWATSHSPRRAELRTAGIKHLHAFAKEVELTGEEWMGATEFLTATGQASDDKRKEFILLSDVLGLSMLVVMMNGRLPTGATPTTVLGPFHIEDSPVLASGESMAEGVPGEPCYVTGQVRGLDGKPLAGVVLDVWQADTDGLYESQIPGQDEARLRALYTTGDDGTFCVRTVNPKGYSIPMDGPVGALISKTEISHFRPAHIHFLLSAPGHESLVSCIYRRGADYIDSDVVFGCKLELTTDFTRHAAGLAPTGEAMNQPFWTVAFDFVLSPTP